jgi:DNA polymerase III subunit delta'
MYELDVLGQELPRKLLLKAYSDGNAAHSYLLMGPAGTGKYSMAIWYTGLLNCREPVDSAFPCGICSSCKKILLCGTAINHPDVRVISPDPQTHNIKIEQIRELQKESLYMPFESPWKVHIINEAHRMLDSAANCLLKILEEPPPRVINILISSNLYTLLPTIVSRCQIIKFTPVEAPIVADYLMRREDIPEERSLVYAHIAQGSVGKALELCRKEGLWDLRKKVLDVLGELPDLSPSEIMLMVDKFSRDREEVELTIEIVLSWLRDLIFIKEAADSSILINVDRVPQLEKQVVQLTTWQMMNCINYGKEAQIQLKTQVTPAFVLQRLFVSLNKIQTALGSS